MNIRITKVPGLLAGLLLLLAAALPAQPGDMLGAADRDAIHEIEDTLAVLGFAVINDSLPDERFLACRQMIPTLVRALKKPHSFDYPFERLKSVSIQYPADSTFRIFTWQLYVDENDYRYFGAIQLNTPQLQLIPLVDRSFQVEAPEQAALSPDQWYGAVYYNLMTLDSPQGKYYLLFGFDGYELFRKRKVLDVLTFNERGEAVFGAPVIPGKAGAPPRHRMVLEYSAEASIRLNYDAALDLVIFDHLITMGGQHGEGPVNFPDGSYEAFKVDKGRLSYIDKVWNQVSDEPPRPTPILDQRKKDILGKN